MGRVSRVAGALISLGVSIISILFLYGYLSPIGLSPASIFGPSYADFFGGSLGGGSVLTGTYSPLVPGGIVGLLAYTILTRMGSITRAATAPNMPSADEMMRRMNIPGMMSGMNPMMGAQAMPPRELPADISKPQFVLLRSYRQGLKNPKEVAKALSMDKKEVEGMTSSLVTAGYLTKDNKLTAKSLELFA